MANEADWASLSKSERRKRARDEKKRGFQKEELKSGAFKKLILILVLVVLIYVGYKGWRWINTPVETISKETLSNFQTFPDQGQDHIKEGETVEYNSNPPTSGPHYTEWTKAGVYSEPIEDGNLIHSLEHGYIVISYNCEKLGENGSCDELESNLESVYKDKGKGKIVVVPRPGLDTQIALTAWTKLDKFDGFDKERIESFINAFRNRGPENAP